METAFERVQLMFGLENIVDVNVANNILYIAVGAGTIVRIDLGDPSRVVDMQLPNGASSVRKIFVCPWTGAHMIVLTSSGDHYYVHVESTKFRALTSLRGFPTKDILWNPASTSRRLAPIVLASPDGLVEYLLQGTEKYFRRDSRNLISLWNGGSVEALALSKDDSSKKLSIFALLSDAKIVRWCGELDEEGCSFRNVIKDPLDMLGVVSEGNASNYSLELSPDGKFGVAGVDDNLVTFHTDDHHVTEINLGDAQWAKGGWFILSEFHIILAIPKVPSLLLVNIINGEAFKGPLLPYECQKFRGAMKDGVQKTYWTWTQDEIYELKIEHENKGISALLATQGRYKEALDVAPPQARKHLFGLWASQQVTEDKIKAAQLFACSDVSIETATLNFVDEPRAMAEFLSTTLKNVQHKAPKVALSTWLIELYAHIKDYGSLEKVLEVPEQFDAGVVLQILREQGLSAQLLRLMEKIGDWAGLVDFYVAHEQWGLALECLRAHEHKESIYKHINVLLENSPKETCESLMRIRDIEPNRLLPALIQHATEKTNTSQNQAVRYMRFLLFNEQVNDQCIYNAFVAVHALRDDDEQELLNFLRKKATSFADHDFSLRICLNHKCWKAATFLLTLMGLYEEAVNLALKNNLLDEAAEVVDQLPDGRLRKHLLLEVAEKTISCRGPQAAMRFVGLLRVDDLLNFFPEFETLDELAPEIVKGLERAKIHLGAITDEVEESLQASKELHDESHKFSERSVIIEPGEPCAICDYPLVTRHFYAFPCQHAFHSDCLSDAIKNGVDTKRKKKLADGRTNEAMSQECVLCSEKRIQLLDTSLVPPDLT